jgi:hypothetical protein
MRVLFDQGNLLNAAEAGIYRGGDSVIRRSDWQVDKGVRIAPLQGQRTTNLIADFRRFLRFEYRSSRRRRRDVLVHAEEVSRIVLRLHGRETFVVVAVGRLNAPLGLVVHHEVDVSPFEVERVNSLPILASPCLQGIGLLRVGADPGDDHGPGRLACVPCRCVLRNATDGSVDGVEVHERQLARRLGRLCDVQDEIRDYQATGAALRLPYFLSLKTEALYLADRTVEALEAIKEAEVVAERSEGHWWCAEMHRLRGVFLATLGAGEPQIEASFCAAIRTAKQQNSISLTKRAEATYAEYRRQKSSGAGGRGLRLPL